MISTDSVALFLGITRPTVIKYIQEGRLEAIRSGKAYKITRSDLERFAREQGMNPARLAELEHLNPDVRTSKKTRSLEPLDPNAILVRNDPTLPLFAEPDVLFFVAVRTHPGARELIFRVTSPKYFIGRHSLASLSIQDPYISSLHATFLFQDSLVKVLDQSTNGTHVRGQHLAHGESALLGDGDQVRVGDVLLTLISPARIESYLAEALT